MKHEDKNIPDFLSKLIDGCSTYIKISNNFWIALAVVSIISISPTKTKDSTISMPFGLGDFKEENFYPFVYVIIALLIIAFGSAFSQALRARKLIQRAITELKDDYIYHDKIYLQDIVDSMIYPTLQRVAPLSQIVQGKKQFFPEAFKRSKAQSWLGFIYYVLLKSVVILVIYILPAYALIISFSRGKLYTKIWNIPSIFFEFIGVFSIIILLQLLIFEIIYIIDARNRILKTTSHS